MTTERGSRGVDMTTLVITAVASAVAAYACSKVWAPGTLPSAALMPVLVALIKEAIERPTAAVTRAVPARGAGRSAPTRDDARPRGRETADGVQAPVARPNAISDGTRSSPKSPRWRLAVITGLLGFVVCVLALTVPELVAGESASGGGRQTTLFGGESGREKRERTTPTTTAPGPAAAPQQRTVTVPPPTTTAPVPTTETPPPVSKPAPAPPPPLQP